MQDRKSTSSILASLNPAPTMELTPKQVNANRLTTLLLNKIDPIPFHALQERMNDLLDDLTHDELEHIINQLEPSEALSIVFYLKEDLLKRLKIANILDEARPFLIQHATTIFKSADRFTDLSSACTMLQKMDILTVENFKLLINENYFSHAKNIASALATLHRNKVDQTPKNIQTLLAYPEKAEGVAFFLATMSDVMGRLTHKLTEDDYHDCLLEFYKTRPNNPLMSHPFINYLNDYAAKKAQNAPSNCLVM